ncbi:MULTISPECIES: Wadjet anti-phage system protein JetD domain-containing protein [Brevibacillus]|jgi:hypothetical protein|uniref:Wadjet anti-phage system protein JetD domain-containing protein n=1 Tax=Brevibacillus TaxID=55080 RepID=UPI001E3B83B6|nr:MULTISPECIES: Wadjet anti-phage system protein JetD domain-containing protein [Bacillales]MDT3416762.1 hypothetical protein [Brevibacillus aydinogluensis]UFJ61295.1 hypothetical protein IRT44_19085 [Anoxybacillus sediminis]
MEKGVNEQRFKNRFLKQVLGFLLEKYERSQAFVTEQPGRSKPQFAIKDSPFHFDYFDEMDFRKREWMHDVLMHLEQQGIVSLSWVKYKEGTELSKVILSLDSVEEAYTLAGITPKMKKIKRLQEIIRPLEAHPWEWVKNWWKQTDEDLSRRKSSGLDLDDPDGYADLVKVLIKLPDMEQDTPKRLFSQEVFLDSKHFEQKVERRLVSLLKTCVETEFETDQEYLDSIGIVQHPRSVFVSGMLQFRVGETIIHTKGLPGGIGLSRQTIARMEILDLPIERIIMIENLTSYHQWIRHRSGANELVIYTGGFPDGVLKTFLSKLGTLFDSWHVNIPVYHWGDIDLGGIRIFEYLKQIYFKDLHPLWMDEHILVKYKDKGIPIKESYLSKVEALLDDPRFSTWENVLRAMLKHRIRLEQETVFEYTDFTGKAE